MPPRTMLQICLWVACVAGVFAEGKPQIHFVTFGTEMYRTKLADSLKAKQLYAKHWGYTWEVFDEETLDCTKFRPFRWRGDHRYCKLEALMVVWRRIRDQRAKKKDKGQRDFLFWHDIDTHIMRPQSSLIDFVNAAGDNASVIFTDNALSLNNGVFFLEYNNAGQAFFKKWRAVCKKGEWPWADNGCMYEAMLQYFGGDRYLGHCAHFGATPFDQLENPGIPDSTGSELMKCFNEEMAALGIGCCVSRGIPDFAWLSGIQDSFNHHACEDLLKNKAFADQPRELIGQHCYKEGGFMVHSKDDKYATESLKRVMDYVAKHPAGASASSDEL